MVAVQIFLFLTLLGFTPVRGRVKEKGGHSRHADPKITVISLSGSNSSSSEISIPEDIGIGTYVAKVSITSENFEHLTCSLNDQDEFFLWKFHQTGEYAIVVVNELDYEENVGFNLIIQCSNRDNPDLNLVQENIDINLLDVNDNSPQIRTSKWEARVPEDAPINTFVTHISVSDSDSGNNGKTSCNINDDNFKLEELYSGEYKLLTSSLFNREEQVKHTVTITCGDFGIPPLTSRKHFNVLIDDVNEYRPDITVTTLSHDGQVMVSENAPANTFVALISVFDQDSGENGMFSCSIDTDHFSLEKLYDTEFKLMTTASFDREKMSQYTVRIMCMDHGNPPLKSHVNLVVSISDVNDNIPVFSKAVYLATIEENNSGGTWVVQVSATDRDINENGAFGFSIKGESTQVPFDIEEDTGVIMTTATLDYEQINKYHFEVLAVDRGIPARTGSAIVEVYVQDVNDYVPQFQHSSYTFAAFENQAIDTQVGEITVTDHDNVEVTYSISNGEDDVAGLFKIDAKTGRINTLAVLDREEKALYKFKVEAKVNSHYSTKASADVTVYVTDVNDNVPEFVFPSVCNNSIHISRDLMKDMSIELDAHDNDTGSNAAVSFRISKASEEDIFSIDDHKIVVQSVDDDMKFGVFYLQITAEDHGAPPLSSVTDLFIVVDSD